MTKSDFKAYLLQFLNEPYRWGGDDPMGGFDCSGFTQEALAALGLDPEGDQSADALLEHFRKPGNGVLSYGPSHDTGYLAFYGKDGKATHVAPFFDEHTIIEAGGGGSKTATLQDAIAQNAFVRLRPFSRRKDLICVVRPDGLAW